MKKKPEKATITTITDRVLQYSVEEHLFSSIVLCLCECEWVSERSSASNLIFDREANISKTKMQK